MLKKLLILVVLLSPILFGCKEDTPVTPSTNGNIAGVVLDFDSALPLENVFVSTIPITTTVKTDAQGRFTLENLEAQVYKLVVEKSGYDSYTTSISVLATKTTQITVPLKSKTSGYGTISGFVTNKKDLKPISNVIISISPAPDGWTDISTDDTGYYTIQLPAGVYTMHLTKTDFKSISKVFTLTKSESANLDIVMEEGTTDPPIDENLYVYYSFDTQLGGSAVKDNSGNGYNAQIVNNCQYETGKFGSAIKTIEGSGYSGGWIKMDFPFNLSEFTISFWVKEVSAEFGGGQAYFQAGNNDDGVCLMGRNGAWSNMNSIGDGINYHFAVGANSNDYNGSKVPLAVNDVNYNPESWNMLTMTYKNGKFYAYINGNLVGSKNQPFSVVQSDLMGLGIQWWESSASTRLTAYYDEFRIYTVSLTQSQITNLYETNSLN
ncbi:MAG: carboxypeptidase regulatory-like domain-containing protein [bacterium]